MADYLVHLDSRTRIRLVGLVEAAMNVTAIIGAAAAAALIASLAWGA